jgi:polyribonucleotide nucleotidyltransferase
VSHSKKSFQFGDHTVTIETGEVARQADGAVLVTMSETVVLVTAVGLKKPTPGRDFFPLTVNYQEKTYAAGRIPGGFFKREGRPTEKETLTSRLIDRPIRPLFPEGFTNDVQVVASVLSVNSEVDPDVASLIGASAALAISGMPFLGPIGAARVGYQDGKYILNPTATQLNDSKLDLVVAGTEEGVLMVESEANGLDEDVMLGAVMFGHEKMQVAIQAIKELAAEAGKPKWDWAMPLEIGDLKNAVSTFAEKDLAAAYALTEKQQRHAKIGEIKNAVLEGLLRPPACQGKRLRPAPGRHEAALQGDHKRMHRQELSGPEDGEPRGGSGLALRVDGEIADARQPGGRSPRTGRPPRARRSRGRRARGADGRPARSHRAQEPGILTRRNRRIPRYERHQCRGARTPGAKNLGRPTRQVHRGDTR